MTTQSTCSSVVLIDSHAIIKNMTDPRVRDQIQPKLQHDVAVVHRGNQRRNVQKDERAERVPGDNGTMHRQATIKQKKKPRFRQGLNLSPFG